MSETPLAPAAQTISTAELARLLNSPDLVLLDVRPISAYNGWRPRGEARGGHIPGARAFPLSWLDLLKPGDLEALLAAKGAAPAAIVVVYGYTAQDSEQLIARLRALNYPNVRNYAAGFHEWAADSSLPLERLPRFEKLVSPEWLYQLINGGRPETYRGNGYAVFHVNFGVPEEYADGHIPGAFYLDTNSLEAPDTWNRRSPAELEAALLAHGITRDKTIVLYGRDTVGDPNAKWPGRHAGQISAARAALILMYAGVEDVRLLDGGYDWWVNAGYELETTSRTPEPAAAFGAQIPARPRFIADLPEAKEIIASPRAELVAIRTWTEHIGEISGYNYIGRSGRIAGSIWGNCGSDAYHMQHYRNVDNTMREYHEIAANWAENGITADKRIAFYCGTGWRASETFFYAYIMGWDDVAVYDGGWFEWAADPANPVEVGPPPGMEEPPAFAEYPGPKASMTPQ